MLYILCESCYLISALGHFWLEFIGMLIDRKLVGKTVFITGGSRGIGKEIALKAAKDGANIVIAAKTADPHPKLPGTIFSSAKEGKL